MKLNLKKLSSRQILLIQAVIMGLLPLLCCVVHCALQGYTVNDVYLPASQWNDEMFYFKQVEAMLSYGYPYGYFGYNESHAQVLSFGAWTPLLVFPWLIFGKLFGWGLLAPIYYNILLMTVAVVLFVLLAKPSWKQLGILAILYCVFMPFVRYMLCGMLECTCFCMAIIFFGLMWGYLQEEKTWKLVLLFVVAGLMTLMRPYLILFLLFPIAMWVLRNRKWGILGSIGVLAVVGGLYVTINHYLCADYFEPIFRTDWLDPFLRGEILTGIKGVFSDLYHNGKLFIALTIQGLKTGFAQGAYFSVYLAILALLIWQAVAEFRRKDKKTAWAYAYLAFCFLALMAACILMYRMQENSRHMLTFTAMGVFVLSMMRTRFYKKAMFFAALCVYLFGVTGDSPDDYQVYFYNEGKAAQLELWEETFEEELVLSTENVPSYENVVIWVFSDEPAAGGEAVLTDWQQLYGLPTGFAINCCYSEYVIENFDNIQSKYVVVPVGSRIEQMCKDAGKRLVIEDGRACMYEMYGE